MSRRGADMDTERIEALVRDVATGLGIDVGKGDRFDDLGIDSLTAIDLITRVETAFGIEIPDSALYSIESVSALVDYLTEATA
jgi:acyl carrier protein